MRVTQTRVGLADRYGIHRKTFARWLASIGITHSCGLTPIEMELVNNKIGSPEKLREISKQLLK